MSAIDRAVDAVPLIVGVLTKCFEQTLPDTLACPTVEPVEHGLPGSKVAGKISPRRACTPPPQYRFYEVAIVTPRTPGAFPHAQRCFDPLPLPLIQLQVYHRGHPMEHTRDSMESPLFCALRRSARPARPAGRGARGSAPRHKPRPTKRTGPTTPHGPSGTGTGTFTGTRAIPIQGHALVRTEALQLAGTRTRRVVPWPALLWRVTVPPSAWAAARSAPMPTPRPDSSVA